MQAVQLQLPMDNFLRPYAQNLGRKDKLNKSSISTKIKLKRLWICLKLEKARGDSFISGSLKIMVRETIGKR
jgi:hypothetical protein